MRATRTDDGRYVVTCDGIRVGMVYKTTRREPVLADGGRLLDGYIEQTLWAAVDDDQHTTYHRTRDAAIRRLVF